MNRIILVSLGSFDDLISRDFATTESEVKAIIKRYCVRCGYEVASISVDIENKVLTVCETDGASFEYTLHILNRIV